MTRPRAQTAPGAQAAGYGRQRRPPSIASEISLAAVVTAIGRARAYVTSIVTAWGLKCVRDDAALLTSELGYQRRPGHRHHWRGTMVERPGLPGPDPAPAHRRGRQPDHRGMGPGSNATGTPGYARPRGRGRQRPAHRGRAEQAVELLPPRRRRQVGVGRTRHTRRSRAATAPASRHYPRHPPGLIGSPTIPRCYGGYTTD